MPCDKFMQLPLEERIDISKNVFIPDNEDIAYRIRVNPTTQNVEYQFPPSSGWISAD